VAFISRAQGVMLVFQRDLMEAINNVAFPGFARARREGGDMERIYCRTVMAVTALAWPFYGFFALFPLESLRVLFGPQWDAAAPLVPLFCLAGALGAISNMIPSLLNASGRIDLITRVEMITQPLRVVVVVGAAFLFESLMPVALASVIMALLIVPMQYWIKGKALATDWGEIRASAVASAKLALASLTLPGMVKLLEVSGYWNWSGLAVLSVAAVSALVSWILGLRWLDHPLVTDPIFPERLRRLIQKS
jgi:O-antigen/teichoic acid export membrane protein